MKKMIILLLAIALVLCAAGCAAPKAAAPSPSLPPAASVNSPGINAELGITLTLKDLTRSGATIVCAQSGGDSVSELSTGSFFIVERLTETGWVEVEQRKLDGDLAWTMEAYIVTLNGTTEWDLNWEWLYGELELGHYRVGKEFMNFRGPGDSDHVMIYTEFSFGEMLIAE